MKSRQDHHDKMFIPDIDINGSVGFVINVGLAIALVAYGIIGIK